MRTYYNESCRCSHVLTLAQVSYGKSALIKDMAQDMVRDYDKALKAVKLK